MTQRIGTGANAQITTYGVTVDTTPRPLETQLPTGQTPITSALRVLSTGPVNPGRLYVQGVLLVNRDAAITVYASTDASAIASTSTAIPPGAALRLDVNRADGVFLFSASGTPTVTVLGV
jgi:hypothetical protein